MPTSSRARTKRVAFVDAFSTGRHLPPALHRLGKERVHVQSPSPDVHMARLPFPEGFVIAGWESAAAIHARTESGA